MNGMESSSLNLGHERNWESQLDMISDPSILAKCDLHPNACCPELEPFDRNLYNS